MKTLSRSLVTLVLCYLSCVVETAELKSKLIQLEKCAELPSVDFLSIPAHLVYSKENVTFGLSKFRKTKSWCERESFGLRLELSPPPPPEGPESASSSTAHSSHVDREKREAEEAEDYAPPVVVQKYFLKNGILRFDRDYYQPSEFCIRRIEKLALVLEVCPAECDARRRAKYRPCVKKCCSLGTSLNINQGSCSPTGSEEWTPFIYSNPYALLKAEEQQKFQPHISQSPPSCQEEQHALHNRHTAHQDMQPWRLLADGKIWYLGGNRRWTELATDNYCMDAMVDYGDGELYTGHPSDQILLICPEDESGDTNGKFSPLYVSVMLISSVFLLLTAIVYVLLWDRQSNIHTWTVLAQVISMFFLYVFLATANLMSLAIPSHESGIFCKLIGILAHYFFLTTFCWLTVINFDLCTTFRSMSPGMDRSKAIRRFLCYCAFAFTLPTAVITTGLILDHLYADDVESEVVTPLYGQITCYIAVWAQGVYVYYIIGTLFIINFVLMLVTAVTIFKLRQTTQMVANSRTSHQRQSLKLFGKLFVVMGVTWVFEVISWWTTLSSQDKTPWYWMILDLINILQAVAIFVIFVCKRRTLNQLQQRCPCFQKFLNPVLRSWNGASRQKSADANGGEAEFEHQTTTATSLASKRNSDSRL